MEENKATNEEYRMKFQTIWANMDPNGHMRHSAYNDYAAQVRVQIFSDYGLSFNKLMKKGIGPVLFREETLFYKEIRLNEMIEVDFQLLKVRRDGSKFSILHKVYNAEGSHAASVTVDGAWLDLIKRKVAAPPQELNSLILRLPRSIDFDWIPDKKKL